MQYDSIVLVNDAAFDFLSLLNDWKQTGTTELQHQECLIRVRMISEMLDVLMNSTVESVLCVIRKAMIAFGGTFEKLNNAKCLDTAIDALEHTVAGLQAALNASC